MTGDNRCRCETCNCNTNATRKVSLDKLPGHVLVVQLECFLRVSETRSTKIHAKVAVDPSLMLACPDTGKEVEYILFSLVLHEGSSLEGGHYTSIGRCSGPSVCPSVNLSVRLSARPPVRPHRRRASLSPPPVRPSVRPSICLSVRPSVRPSICLSVCPSARPPVRPRRRRAPVRPSVRLSVCPSVCPSVCQSVDTGSSAVCTHV
jgi:hypothetical protein